MWASLLRQKKIRESVLSWAEEREGCGVLLTVTSTLSDIGFLRNSFLRFSQYVRVSYWKKR